MGADAAGDSPAKRGRVGGFVVNMVGGVEHGFDGWDTISTECISTVGGEIDGDLEEDFPEPETDEETEQAATSSSTDDADLAGASQPYDQRTGLPIPCEMAQEGRRTELRKMQEHGVYKLVPLDKLQGKRVGVKWVEEVRTQANGAKFARCR